jgi:ribonuclease HI
MSYQLYFDGACKFNNQSTDKRKAGSGAVIFKDDIEIDSIINNLNTLDIILTNNVAEYYALIIGLEKAIELNITDLIVKGDSLLVINQVNQKFKINSKHLLELYNQVILLKKKFNNISFQHIPRNLNKRADQLANECII